MSAKEKRWKVFIPVFHLCVTHLFPPLLLALHTGGISWFYLLSYLEM